MNKNLPRVYANPINKELHNNKDIYISSKENKTPKDSPNVLKEVNEIFSNPHHVYKSRVRITTKDQTYETTVVGKSGSYLLTLNGEKININDILDITRL